MGKIVVITGAGPGVDAQPRPSLAYRAAPSGWSTQRRNCPGTACGHCRFPATLPTNEAVDAAAERAENELGPIDIIWVNVAMATVFAPVAKLTAAEVARGTAATYLGQVHGMMCALKRMRQRSRDSIVNVVRRSVTGRSRCSRCIAGPSSRSGDSRTR